MTHETFEYIKENPLLPFYIHKHVLYDYIRMDTPQYYCVAFIYGGD